MLFKNAKMAIAFVRLLKVWNRLAKCRSEQTELVKKFDEAKEKLGSDGWKTFCETYDIPESTSAAEVESPLSEDESPSEVISQSAPQVTGTASQGPQTLSDVANG